VANENLALAATKQGFQNGCSIKPLQYGAIFTTEIPAQAVRAAFFGK
jgi:hypothetical protein